MYYNNERESFEYYSDNTIPYRYLETVGRKYVKTFNCKKIYVDMDFELKEFERKQKEEKEKIKLEKEEKEKIKLEKDDKENETPKKDVFAKFKNYNKESGTGRVNKGAAPPKNSIPNNRLPKGDETVILKENANRYTCEGRIINFNFLKKPDRKKIDKKYALSFADYKKIVKK
jgi:DNA repair exonuclease SbcCD nuclease subunit